MSGGATRGAEAGGCAAAASRAAADGRAARPKAAAVRALLEAFAVGDAVGMATEFMTRREIVERFDMVSGLTEPALSKNHGDLRRGQVTDDTEQVLCLLTNTALQARSTRAGPPSGSCAGRGKAARWRSGTSGRVPRPRCRP